MAPDVPGTGGLLKCRYTDFLVNEVREDDKEVVRLTDLSIPEAIRTRNQTAVPTTATHGGGQGDQPDPAQVAEEGYATLRQVLGETEAADVNAFFSNIIASQQGKMDGAPPIKKAKIEDSSAAVEEDAREEKKEVAQTFVMPVMKDKDQRTKLHQAVKAYFPWCASDTIQHEDGTSRIRIMTRALAKSGDKRKHDLGRVDGRTIHEWPAGRPDFLRFTMFKTNMDTIAAVSELAYQLHMPSKVFGYAGTKDRRGVTCQEVTLHKTNAEKLAGLNNRLRQIKLGNFSYTPTALNLGELAGNRFTITLRSLEVEDAVVERALASVKNRGFVNYFGLQRFGTSAVPTQAIGHAILQSDFEKSYPYFVLERIEYTPKVRPSTVTKTLQYWIGMQSHH